MHLVGGLLLVHTLNPLVMTFDLANSMAAHKVDPESKQIIITSTSASCVNYLI